MDERDHRKTGMMAGQPQVITVRFMGGSLVPGLPGSVTLPASGPITAGELFARLQDVIGVSDLRERVSKSLIVLIDGASIQHKEGWETLVRPGANVSVVAPMGGG